MHLGKELLFVGHVMNPVGGEDNTVRNIRNAQSLARRYDAMKRRALMFSQTKSKVDQVAKKKPDSVFAASPND